MLLLLGYSLDIVEFSDFTRELYTLFSSLVYFNTCGILLDYPLGCLCLSLADEVYVF
jgi:hypothetical protein